MEESYIRELKTAIDSLDLDSVRRLKQLIMSSDRIFTIGNGGSMALAMHLAEDLMKMQNKNAQCISDPSLMSMVSNDEMYENVFLWPLERLVSSNDLVIALSVSGTSPNIVKVVESGLNCKKFLITGPKGKNAGCEKIVVITGYYQICEDVFSMICHMLLDDVQNIFVFPRSGKERVKI